MWLWVAQQLHVDWFHHKSKKCRRFKRRQDDAPFG